MDRAIPNDRFHCPVFNNAASVLLMKSCIMDESQLS